MSRPIFREVVMLVQILQYDIWRITSQSNVDRLVEKLIEGLAATSHLQI